MPIRIFAKVYPQDNRLNAFGDFTHLQFQLDPLGEILQPKLVGPKSQIVLSESQFNQCLLTLACHCDMPKFIEAEVAIRGGEPLSADEAAKALDEARKIIETVGTVAVNDQIWEAARWMQTYFPDLV